MLPEPRMELRRIGCSISGPLRRFHSPLPLPPSVSRYHVSATGLFSPVRDQAPAPSLGARRTGREPSPSKSDAPALPVSALLWPCALLPGFIVGVANRCPCQSTYEADEQMLLWPYGGSDRHTDG